MTVGNLVTQVAVEVLDQSTDAKSRVTQAAVEVLENNSDAKTRVTQVAVEVLVSLVHGDNPGTGGMRVQGLIGV